MQKNRGVEFILGRKTLKYEGDGELVSKIHLKGKTVDTDYLLYFPNNFIAKTDMFDNSSYFQDLSFDKNGRLLVDIDLNAKHNRIFGAGEAVAAQYFRNSERMNNCNTGMSISQGMFAAYNILGIGIPYMIVPYADYNFYGKIFREAGSMNYFEKSVIEGDLDDFNYTAYYANRTIGVQKAAGFQKKDNAMSIIREAFRTSIPVEQEVGAPFSSVDLKWVEKAIRVGLRLTLDF